MKVIQYLRLKDDDADSMAEMMSRHQMDAVRFHPTHPAVERIPNSLQGLKKRGKRHETNRLHHSDEHISVRLCSRIFYSGCKCGVSGVDGLEQ